jgi:type VII secretion system (Wss) protein YukD
VHTRILVSLTIEAQWSIDLEVPGDIEVHALIPALLDVCGIQLSLPQFKVPDEWSLGLKDSPYPLDEASTLVDAGVLDGAELILQHMQTRRTQPRPLFSPKTILPQQGGISITWDKEGLRS